MRFCFRMNERQAVRIPFSDRTEILALTNQSIDRNTMECDYRFPRHVFWCQFNFYNPNITVQIYYRGHRVRENLTVTAVESILELISNTQRNRLRDFRQEFVAMDGTLVSLLTLWNWNQRPVNIRGLLEHASIVGVSQLDFYFSFRGAICQSFTVYLNA